MANHIDDMSSKLVRIANFQEKFEDMVKKLLDDQNTLRQEIFLLRNEKFQFQSTY